MENKGNFRLTVNRETLVDRLVQLLQESILTGKINPKTRLSEAGVAGKFGVSRAPAREALQRLEEMNLVRKTHLGREVVKFSREEFNQIYELKNVIEAFGVMKGSLLIQEKELARLRSIFCQMEQCLTKGDLSRLRYLNYEFHDLMVSCCQNEKLVETYSSLVKKVRWATSLSLELPARPEESFREHKLIYEAFLQRDTNTLRALLEDHSNKNMRRILSQMETMEEGLKEPSY